METLSKSKVHWWEARYSYSEAQQRYESGIDRYFELLEKIESLRDTNSSTYRRLKSRIDSVAVENRILSEEMDEIKIILKESNNAA